MGSKWKSRVAFVLAVVALALVPRLAAAAPARYVFEICDSALPGGGVGNLIAGQHPRFGFGLENSCAQPNGALIVRQPEMPARDGGEASWGVPIAAPPGTGLESITVTATSCAGPPSVASVVVPGWPRPICAQEVRTFPLEDRFQGFSVSLTCVDFGTGPCHAGPWVSAHYFATTLADSVAPSLGEPSGSLLADGERRGRQSLAVEASDAGGGLSSIYLWVNGLPAGWPRLLSCNVAQTENPSVAGTVAAQAAPCPQRASAEWTIDTGAYPFRNGPNRVQVCASDFATLSDPNTGCLPAHAIDVDNSCGESPVGGGEVLSAQFSGSHSDTTTVRYGKAAAIQGRLTTDAGDPVRGATLCVKAQTIAVDQGLASVGSIRTDAEGEYRYEVAPGPNREVVIGYRHDSKQIARDVRYYAHVRPTLKLAPGLVHNGERVRLWGELPGPRAGRRVVVLQANAPGSKRWITFRRATTGAEGDYRSGYRFSSTTRRTRYRFRAVVPRQDGYPWVEGHSAPVTVVVKG